MTEIAYLFPGQGSQAIGMGKALAQNFQTAKNAFQEVDDALGENLSKLIWEGPDEKLRLTENAQPAIMTVSIAAGRALLEEGYDILKKGRFVAGHSLGEYSALAAVGSLSLKDAARLLRLRGRAMQQAVPEGEGSMAAILGMDMDEVIAIAREAETDTKGVCEAANDNAPGQVVLSGDAETVKVAIAKASARGAKRAMPLKVSAPFHCRLMSPAADMMKDALATAKISPPSIPIVPNVIARETSDVEAIRGHLLEQITGRVRWRESVSFMAEAGASVFVELGEGRVLSALVKRIVKGAEILAAGAPEDIAAIMEAKHV